MKKIKIIFESDEKKIGYVIFPEEKRFTTSSFDDNYEQIDINQDELILNPRTFVQQIVAVLMSVLRG